MAGMPSPLHASNVVCAQAVGYEGLSGSQQLDILDALIHVATDSEVFRTYIVGTVRQQACLS